MESTGRYHQLLAQMAIHAGMHVYVLNARDVHEHGTNMLTQMPGRVPPFEVFLI